MSLVSLQHVVAEVLRSKHRNFIVQSNNYKQSPFICECVCLCVCVWGGGGACVRVCVSVCAWVRSFVRAHVCVSLCVLNREFNRRFRFISKYVDDYCAILVLGRLMY